jgi:hypothetical protein
VLLFTFNKELECLNGFCLFPFLGRFFFKIVYYLGCKGAKVGFKVAKAELGV